MDSSPPFMDTRSKIVDMVRAHELAARGSLCVVMGYFDPLLAAHAIRLAEIRSAHPGAALMALVLDPPQPLLELRARAELVAALAQVDFVVPAATSSGPLLGAEWVDETAADLERRRALIEHVHRRHTN